MICVCVCACVCTYLWDDGDPGTELVEPQLCHVHAVDEDVALRRLDDAEQAQSQRGLPGSGAAHDPHLDIQTVTVEEHLKVSQVTCWNHRYRPLKAVMDLQTFSPPWTLRLRLWMTGSRSSR